MQRPRDRRMTVLVLEEDDQNVYFRWLLFSQGNKKQCDQLKEKKESFGILER